MRDCYSCAIGNTHRQEDQLFAELKKEDKKSMVQQPPSSVNGKTAKWHEGANSPFSFLGLYPS